jgi:hypothetical protein
MSLNVSQMRCRRQWQLTPVSASAVLAGEMAAPQSTPSSAVVNPPRQARGHHRPHREHFSARNHSNSHWAENCGVRFWLLVRSSRPRSCGLRVANAAARSALRCGTRSALPRRTRA